MRVFCIGVSPLDQSRGSNSYTGKIDQTWSRSPQTFNRPTINKNLLAAIGVIADWTQLRVHCLSYQISHPPPGAYLNLLSWHADYRWSKNNGWPSSIVNSIVFISFISRKVLHLSIIKVRPLLALFDLLWLVKKWIWFYSRGFFSYKISCSLDLSKSFLQLLFLTILVPKVVIGVTWILSINLCNHWQVLYLGNSSTSWQWRDTVHFYTIDFFSSLLIRGVWGTSVFFSMINLCVNSWIMWLNFPGGW